MKTIILLFSVLFTTMSFAQVPNYVPANGLVGWWPFNGNVNDESGNGNNGSNNGATLTTDRNGNVNSAYSFDGVDDFNEIDVNSYLQNGLTISVWIVSNLPNDQFTHKGIVWTRLSGPQGNPPFQPNQTTGLMIYPDGLLCNASDGYSNGVSLQDSGNYYNDNSWYHLVFSYDVITGLTRITINGNETVSLNSISLSNIDLAYNTIKIGKDEIVGYGNRHWYGKIDDIGIWNRALTECEIQNLYTSSIPTNTITTASACDSYLWNGTTYTASGVYTEPTANCVTESLNLTITPSSTNATTATACDSYTWNGTNYTASGVYTGTTSNCVTESLNLTITPSSTNATSETACDSYTWNGTNYTASGVYTGTTTNCVTESLNLTIIPSSTNLTSQNACDTYTWNGQTYTASGVYTGTTANCVTQALNLTINTNTSSSISQTALDSYTWPVNNQTYTTTGAYTAVIPNAAGCDSTITLNLTMSFTGINDLSASKLSIYPNPTNGDFTITGLELLGTVSSLILTDMNGKVVKVLDTKATKFSMASIKPGIYFLNIMSGNKEEVLKIVKE